MPLTMKTLGRKAVLQPRDIPRADRAGSVPASSVQAGTVSPRAAPARTRTILVPIDYSEPSRRAFELACALAGNGAARLTLLHVAEPPQASSLSMAAGPPLPAGYRGAWERQLRLIRPRDPAVPVDYRIEEGAPAPAILRAAGQTGCDLIVMGTRPKSGIARLVWRGVSERVSRQAPCPALILSVPPSRASGDGPQPTEVRDPTGDSFRRGDMLNFRTILHPTDFSRTSLYAFGLARDLARASGSELLVIHVAPVHLYRKQRHRREMDEALRRLTTSDPTVRMRGLLLAGDPALQIVSTAMQLDCGLIVMAKGRRTALGRMLRGSVSGAVQKGVRCPVLSVRQPDRKGWNAPDFSAGPPAINRHAPRPVGVAAV